jgi:nucleoside-diphosphate-sugar epimerase
VAALAERGFRLRLLLRREPDSPGWRGFAPEVVWGGLEDGAALTGLVAGADVVIHLAGLVRARSRAAFLAANRDGAGRLAATVRDVAPAAHLIGISSLAARAPRLSPYAASKRAGERAMAEAIAGGRLTILRPAVIYGPWDTGTLAVFRAARRPVVPVPGPATARIALIHVADAAAAIAALAAWAEAPGGACYALAGPNPAGYAPRDIMATAAAALGNHPRFVRVPPAALLVAGQAASLWAWLGGRAGIFSAGKAREMAHPDWSVTPADLLPAVIARPGIALAEGFAATAAWYRAAGWLP